MTILYSQLLGGIGNILFIVANIYSLSLDRKMKFSVSNNTISCTKRSDEKEWLNTILKYIRKVNNRPSSILKYRFNEKSMKYQTIPNSKGLGLELNGYFQSEKYFKHNKNEIIDLFTKYKNTIQKKLNKIFNHNGKSLSLHIRRGDYINLQHAHVVQDISYYEEALQKMCYKLKYDSLIDMNKDYRLVIFSDDINWCKNLDLFKKFKNIKYMNKSTIEDLYLMSMCNHHIIANSTFSWWGSYLNNRNDKIVIAPSKWFNPNYKKPDEWQDIYCEDWIII